MKQKSILIIEDDAYLRRDLYEKLNRSGYEVLTAGNGQEGLDIIRQHSVKLNLVIVDGSLSGLKSEDVVRELKSDARTSHLPVLLGVEINSQSHTDLLAVGADDYVVKPYRVAELVTRIKIALQRVGQDGLAVGAGAVPS